MNIEIYTDGSRVKTLGAGGFCACMLWGGNAKLIYGGELETTNNRMEMMAIIHGLEHAIEVIDGRVGHKVTVYSDSMYCIDGSTKWMIGWKKKNWKIKEGDDVKNKDLWLWIDDLLKKVNVKFLWVPGHSGNRFNEMVDKFACKSTQLTIDEKHHRGKSWCDSKMIVSSTASA